MTQQALRDARLGAAKQPGATSYPAWPQRLASHRRVPMDVPSSYLLRGGAGPGCRFGPNAQRRGCELTERCLHIICRLRPSRQLVAPLPSESFARAVPSNVLPQASSLPSNPRSHPPAHAPDQPLAASPRAPVRLHPGLNPTHPAAPKLPSSGSLTAHPRALRGQSPPSLTTSCPTGHLPTSPASLPNTR